jgi:hypothetical protein
MMTSKLPHSRAENRLVINLKIAKAPPICSRAQPVHLVCCGGLDLPSKDKAQAIVSAAMISQRLSRPCLAPQSGWRWSYRRERMPAGLDLPSKDKAQAIVLAFRGAPRSGSIVVGWTNRILITTFVLWLLVAAFHVRSRSR